MNDKGRPYLNGVQSFAKELKEMPDYSTIYTRATQQRLGPFIFEKESDQDRQNDIERINKVPYELDNGAIYHG